MSAAAAEASRGVPKTPSGRNAYDVFEMDITANTSLEEVNKQFKQLAVRFHPDRPGGSHEKMAELNAAHNLIKENHNTVMRNLSEVSDKRQAHDAYRTHQNERARREEQMGRTGGIRSGNAATQGVRNVNTQQTKEQSRPVRSPTDIEALWSKYRVDTQDLASRMIGRYEVALQHTIFFKKLSMCNEVTVRERWLRKMFVKGVWEEVHELRADLLRKGARNLQQSQLAEAMVAFASDVERRLKDDFERQATMLAQAQLRITMQRITKFVAVTMVTISVVWYGLRAMWRNSFSVHFKHAIFGA